MAETAHPIAGAGPDVTVVVPVRNEAAAIDAVLGDLLSQEGMGDRLEVLVVDGLSADGTREAAMRVADRDPRVRVLDNPRRLSSAARRLGASAARGRVVAFVDGHCRVPSRTMLADALALLERSGASCLARPQPLVPRGGGAVERAVAAARSSAFGHSTASEIYGDREGPCSPVSSGAVYRREVFDRVGSFDPAFDACEDVEFNLRVERAGLLCWTSPRLAVEYAPRRTLVGLWRQMVRYGVGRARLHRKHPGSFTVESLLPVGFLLGLPALAASPFLPRPWGLVVAAPYALWLALALGFSAAAARRRGWALLPLLPPAFAAIHAGLGWGYLRGRLGRAPPPDGRPDLSDRWSGWNRRFVAPVVARRRNDGSLPLVPEMRARLALSREAMERDRLERLRALLAHARDTVPFWRERLARASLDPERLARVEDLARLEPLSKADVVRDSQALLSSAFSAAELVEVRTGGTTGAPVPFRQTRAMVAEKDAATWALRERMGWEAGVNPASLGGAPPAAPAAAHGALSRWRSRLVARVAHRTLYLSAGDVSDAVLDGHAASLRRFPPKALQAYPSAADALARRLLARGERLEVPVVLLTAEPVHDDQRERVARALQADVYSFYGARECGWIASECALEHRLHVNTAGVHLEAGADGALYVTDLVNRAMPLVRYAIGDRGALDVAPCPCGDPRPVLSRLEGRENDVFTTPSGRRVPGGALDRWLRWGLGVVEWQLVQDQPDAVDVLWVAGGSFRDADLDVLRARLDEAFFHEMEFRFRRVESVPRAPSGKVRPCVVNVKAGAPP